MSAAPLLDVVLLALLQSIVSLSKRGLRLQRNHQDYMRKKHSKTLTFRA